MNNLIKRLEDETSSLEERIQLAVGRFAAINLQMEKNQGDVLSWLKLHLLDEDTPNSDRKQLLMALKQCLMCVVDVLSKPQFAEIIFEMLVNTSQNEADVSECLLDLLNNTHFRKYFVYYILKLSDIVSCCVSRFQSMDLLMKERIGTSIIESIRYVYDHTLQNNELKTVVIDSLLISISSIIYNLKKKGIGNRVQSLSDDITFKVLFCEVEFRKLFTSQILKNDCGQSSELEIVVSHVISTIRDYPTRLKPSILSTAYSTLFRGYLLSNASFNNKLKLYFALTSFIHVSPVAIAEFIPKCVIFNENTTTVTELLESLLEFDVPLDSSVSSVSLTDWLTALIDAILNDVTSNFTPAIITLLKIALSFSPVLLENCLRKFTKNVVLLKKTDPRVISAFSDLCVYVLEVHIKLNRMHKFISAVLIAIKDNLGECDRENFPCKHDVLPMEIFTKIQSAVTNLPSTVQNVALLNTLFYHLENDCVVPLERTNSKQVDMKNILLFDIVTYLLSKFIIGTRIMDYSVPDTVKEKFISLMNTLGELLGRFGKVVISKEHVPEFVESFFQICLVWGDMQIVFMAYESTPRKISKQQGLGNNAINLMYLHPYLSDYHWKLIAQRITNFGNENCTKLLNELVLQKIRALPYLEDEINGPYSENVYGDGPAVLCATYLASQTDAKWLFHHISEFVHLLKPVDVFDLSKTLVKYCQICDNEEIADVLSGDFCEMRTLVLAMILYSLHDVSRRLAKSNLKELKRFIRRVDYEEMVQIEMDDEDASVESLNSKLEELSVVLSNDFGFVDEKFNTCEIRKDIFILLKLPARYLKKENKCFVALSILCLIKTLLKQHRSNDQSDTDLLEDISKFLLSVLSDIRLPKSMDCGKLLAWFYRGLKNTVYCDLIMRRLCEADQNLNSGADSVIEIVKAANSGVESSNVFIKSNDEGVDLVASYLINLQKARKRKSDDDRNEVKEKFKKLCYQNFHRVFSAESLTSRPEKNQLALFTLLLEEALNSDNGDQLKKLTVRIPEFISFVYSCDSSCDEISAFVTALMRGMKRLKETIPSDFLINMWTSKWFLSDERLLSLMLKVAPALVYEEMIDMLLSLTEASLSVNDVSQLDSVYRAWKSVFSTSVKEVKTGMKNNVVPILSSCVQKYVILYDEAEHVPSNERDEVRKMFVRLFIVIFRNANISLSYQVIDVSFDLISSIVSSTCSDELLLLEGIELLFIFCLVRKSKLLDRIPPFYLLYKSLYAEIVRRSVSSDVGNSDCLTAAAHKLEKLTDNLVKSKKDFGKTAINAISDLLNIIIEMKLNGEIESHLKNIIYRWISMCDVHGLKYLSTAMSPGTHNLFKQFWSDYKKYYEFTGKV